MSAKAYRIEYSPSAIRDIDDLPPKTRNQVLKKTERLQSGLYGNIKRLTNNDYAYRLRMGDYRILFDVEGELIIIRRVGHRKEIYD
ncbi:MAG: type II toxin-antitoxin system RelE family toxin [Pyrinomonadaceae bacterium]